MDGSGFGLAVDGYGDFVFGAGVGDRSLRRGLLHAANGIVREVHFDADRAGLDGLGGDEGELAGVVDREHPEHDGIDEAEDGGVRSGAEG